MGYATKCYIAAFYFLEKKKKMLRNHYWEHIVPLLDSNSTENEVRERRGMIMIAIGILTLRPQRAAPESVH